MAGLAQNQTSIRQQVLRDLLLKGPKPPSGSRKVSNTSGRVKISDLQPGGGRR
jgi:hypothetical protein